MSGQGVVLPGVANARELGGYRIEGRRIKSGVLIRAASLGNAAPEALEALQKQYKVSALVDFRTSMEHNAMPDPVIPEAENIHLPPFEMEDMLSDVDPALVERFCDPNLDRMSFFEVIYDGGIINDSFYEHFLLTASGKRAWRTFFKVLLAIEDGRAVLWHCTDGKDRTGCAAMLLLFALGADRDTVMRDYLLTNEFNADKLQAVRQKLAPLNWTKDKADGLLFISGGVFEIYMAKAIDTLIEEYGSVEAYLNEELGVGSAEREALRGKFLSNTKKQK